MHTACAHLLCYEEKMPKACKNWNYLTLKILKHSLFQVSSCCDNPLMSENQLVPLFKNSVKILCHLFWEKTVYKSFFSNFRCQASRGKTLKNAFCTKNLVCFCVDYNVSTGKPDFKFPWHQKDSNIGAPYPDCWAIIHTGDSSSHISPVNTIWIQ